MTAGEAKNFHPMRFAMDRLFDPAGRYKPSEILAVLVVIRAMSFDPEAGEFSSFLAYKTIAARTKLGRSTVQAALINHCEKNRSPLLARSFSKMTRGHLHRSYRWTLVTAPEIFAVKRDGLQRRPKRRPTGAAALQQRKTAATETRRIPDIVRTRPILLEGQNHSGQSYKLYRCDCCRRLVTEWSDGRCVDYTTDEPHRCGKQECQSSDTLNRPILATNPSVEEPAVAESAE